jgi:hypothetical protein
MIHKAFLGCGIAYRWASDGGLIPPPQEKLVARGQTNLNRQQ